MAGVVHAWYAKCYNCGTYLTSEEAKDLSPAISKRCDKCVLEEEQEEEDEDDSEEPGTEFKLSKSEQEREMTPVEHAAKDLTVLFKQMLETYALGLDFQNLVRQQAATHFLAASIPILLELEGKVKEKPKPAAPPVTPSPSPVKPSAEKKSDECRCEHQFFGEHEPGCKNEAVPASSPVKPELPCKHPDFRAWCRNCGSRPWCRDCGSYGDVCKHKDAPPPPRPVCTRRACGCPSNWPHERSCKEYDVMF